MKEPDLIDEWNFSSTDDLVLWYFTFNLLYLDVLYVMICFYVFTNEMIWYIRQVSQSNGKLTQIHAKSALFYPWLIFHSSSSSPQLEIAFNVATNIAYVKLDNIS